MKRRNRKWLAAALAAVVLVAGWFSADPWGWFDPRHRAAVAALRAAGARIDRGLDRRVRAVHYLRPSASHDDDLAHLAAFPDLTGVDLKLRGNVTDDDLRHVESLKTLEWFGLATCRGVSDAGLAHLSRLGNLRLLYLANTAVTDEGMGHLKALPLQQIDLFDTRVTPAGVARLRADHPGIVITQ
jgi:hypothetical protein